MITPLPGWRYRDRVYPGSHLVLSQFASDSDAGAMAELRAAAARIAGGVGRKP